MFTYRRIRKIWNKLPDAAKQRIRSCSFLNRQKKRISNLFTKRAEHNDIYDKDFFQRNDDSRMRSAQIMAESIITHFAPSTVIDVGCGSGALLYCLQCHSVKVQGLDYSNAALDICRSRGLNVMKFDLENDVMVDPKMFDLVVSTEVAEHLPESSSERYVDLLCSVSDKVLFTAATPGPGGIDHVNEQPYEYWIEKFNARRFHYDKVLSELLASIWKEKGVLGWYHENVMVFLKEEA